MINIPVNTEITIEVYCSECLKLLDVTYNQDIHGDIKIYADRCDCEEGR